MQLSRVFFSFSNDMGERVKAGKSVTETGFILIMRRRGLSTRRTPGSASLYFIAGGNACAANGNVCYGLGPLRSAALQIVDVADPGFALSSDRGSTVFGNRRSKKAPIQQLFALVDCSAAQALTVSMSGAAQGRFDDIDSRRAASAGYALLDQAGGFETDLIKFAEYDVGVALDLPV